MWRNCARSAVATLIVIAAAVIGLALVGLIFSSAKWGPPVDPIAVFGTFLLYAAIFAFPLIPIGLASVFVVQFVRLPRPFYDAVIWGAAGALLMVFFWNPTIDGIADSSPSTVGGVVVTMIGLGCAVLGMTAWLLERYLGRQHSRAQE